MRRFYGPRMRTCCSRICRKSTRESLIIGETVANRHVQAGRSRNSMKSFVSQTAGTQFTDTLRFYRGSRARTSDLSMLQFQSGRIQPRYNASNWIICQRRVSNMFLLKRTTLVKMITFFIRLHLYFSSKINHLTNKMLMHILRGNINV